jgi:hypothetical protein
VGEDGRAVAFHVLVEAQAKASFGQHTSKRGLADLKRVQAASRRCGQSATLSTIFPGL